MEHLQARFSLTNARPGGYEGKGVYMKFKYTVLFEDGSTSAIYASDVSEAYELALDKFTKKIADIWCD